MIQETDPTAVQPGDLDAASSPSGVGTSPDVPTPDVPSPGSPSPDVPSPDVPGPGVPTPDVPSPDVPAPEIPDPDVPSPPTASAQAEGVGVARDEAPDLTEDATLEAALEALLLVVDIPAGEELLATTLDQPVSRVSGALRRIAARYDLGGRGFELRRIGEGWRLYTRDRFAPYVERYLLDGQRSKLTRAALETLAVIAYRQPTTRSRVAAVRGVNVDGVIRTLLARGLVEETGTDPETGGILYRTTELFLERLGLSSLEQLPPIAPLLPEVDSIDEQL
ncbi:SMC-Scp complex subunit ScpB [Actinoalloteichus hymeniacidonis]|uniref:Segregation and condensation protein B n=1 Tax=Actinoalloteichus hymeniacidonis TaxID=340345 RepID=A0AAC9HRP4_9PSEU|nr:SMC-Scp complex subunit ScpB [Actinoalloteichus hymeniacidonis]AOS64392.1 segregation and condensation protein B [Actinoalloteichus hymeniacidonis]MBB5907540.1 segregation and condensation protein B [Actinoalloteichus hymeniacidonis]